MGLRPPAAVRTQVAGLQGRLRGVRRHLPPDLHVTLRFLGEMTPEELAGLAGTLRAALIGRPPVRAQAGPAVTLLARYAVLPVAGLDDLAGWVDKAVEEALGGRAAPRDLPFLGHLTLGRLDASADPSERDRLRAVRLSAAWPVEQITLFRSAPPGTGGLYQVVETVAMPVSPRPA